jgi:hypothetical protein
LKTSVHTPQTIRARYLRHIYEILNSKSLSDDERLDILLTVKNTVKVYPSIVYSGLKVFSNSFKAEVFKRRKIIVSLTSFNKNNRSQIDYNLSLVSYRCALTNSVSAHLLTGSEKLL